MILSMLATVFGVIGGVVLLPQAIKIFRTKSAKDISLTTYMFMVSGAVVWVLYGIELNSWPLIISNGLGGINCTTIIIGYLKYGKKQRTSLKWTQNPKVGYPDPSSALRP